MKTFIASAWSLFQARAKGEVDPDGFGDPALIGRALGPMRTATRGFWTSSPTSYRQRGRIFRVVGSGHGKSTAFVSRMK